MVEQTPRLDLDTFSEGEAWDHTDTVEALDESAIVHGPIADRPASGEYDDELYHATDQNITWRWDDSSSDWEYFSGQGSSGTPVPGTSHFEAATIDGVNSPYATDPHGDDAHSVNYSDEGHDHTGESINPNSVSTGDLLNDIGESEMQAAWDGLVVPIATGLGMADAIDPSATSTPIQDACDAIETAGQAGKILLPPMQTIQEAGSVNVPEFRSIHLIGTAMSGSSSAAAPEIEFTNTGTSAHGIVIPDGANDNGIFNVVLTGPGSGQTTGQAIRFEGEPRGTRMDNVNIRGWGDHAIYSQSKAFDMNFGKLEVWDVAGGALQFDDLGPGNRISHLRTGTCNHVLFQNGGQLTIDCLNIGGDITGTASGFDDALHSTDSLHIGMANFEPESFAGTRYLTTRFNTGGVTHGPLQLVSQAVDYLYTLDSAGGVILGPVWNNGTVNQNIVDIDSAPSAACWYYGPSGDIDNNAGSSTGLIRSMASAGTGNG